MRHYRSRDLAVETKADLTPVTEADRGVEQALRARLERERPGEAIAGEEYGVAEGDVRWWLDPIDGTKQYARGIPIWATLIALERGGEAVVGVVSAPALGQRWWAVRGERRVPRRRADPRLVRRRGSRMPTSRRRASGTFPRSRSSRRASRSRAPTWTSGSTCSSPRAHRGRLRHGDESLGHPRAEANRRGGRRTVHGGPGALPRHERRSARASQSRAWRPRRGGISSLARGGTGEALSVVRRERRG